MYVKNVQYIQMVIPAPVDKLSLRLCRHLFPVVRALLAEHPVTGKPQNLWIDTETVQFLAVVSLLYVRQAVSVITVTCQRSMEVAEGLLCPGAQPRLKSWGGPRFGFQHRAGCWVREGVAPSRCAGPEVSSRKKFLNSDVKSCIPVTTCCKISCFLKTTAKKLGGGPIHCWSPNLKIGRTSLPRSLRLLRPWLCPPFRKRIWVVDV